MATTESSRYQAVSRKARDFIRAQRLAYDFYEQLYVPPGIRFGYFIPREFGCLLFFTLPEVQSPRRRRIKITSKLQAIIMLTGHAHACRHDERPV
ncbi:hypothetical protein HYQ45_018904 [Verticillium longisporum]|uniref:Uncharacterized protein n=1 Tax=Verticillium longisporum TaxID=100787 RepID=A0A8I2ZP50_VERLO|nr:hypothetical protein HYQ45_018904 [Verticillium longisporum]